VKGKEEESIEKRWMCRWVKRIGKGVGWVVWNGLRERKRSKEFEGKRKRVGEEEEETYGLKEVEATKIN